MNKLFVTFALFALFVAAVSAFSANETIITPFGIRPAACHNKVPSGTRVVKTDAGYDLILPNGKGIESRVSKKECLDYEAQFNAERQARRAAIIESKTNKAPRVGVPDDTIGDGWLDNAYYWTLNPGQLVKSLTGYYQIPNNPQTDNGQILFYFLGIENNMDVVEGTILQPVLQYNNGIWGWSMASWNCCPSGETFEGEAIPNLSAGQTLYGEIVDNGDGSWTILSALDDKSNAQTLTVDGFGRSFNYVDVTQEVYTCQDCSYLSNSMMQFSQISLTLQDGSQPAPNWGSNSPTVCNGNIVISDPYTIGISHN